MYLIVELIDLVLKFKRFKAWNKPPEKKQKKQERTTKHADFPIQPFKENTSEGHHSSLSEIEKHKLEADAVRFKMEAEDAIEARDESDRQLKALSEECSNLKIKARGQ